MKQTLLWLFGAAVFAEIWANYLQINWLILVLKPVGLIFLAIYYFIERKNPLDSKDYLVFWSLFFTICGEFAYNFRQNDLGVLLILIFYTGEHQFYMLAFRREKAWLSNLAEGKNLIKIAPFLLISFLFFGLVLRPNVSDILYPFVLFYSFQATILGALATFRPVPAKSYWLMIAAIFLNIFADSISALFLFKIVIFPFAYFLIMVLFMTSKYLFVQGMLASRETT